MATFSDQSTSELRANLRAQREHAAAVSGWRRKSALQSIVEIEAELEARGEPPEPEPAKPKRGPQPKGYHTPQRLKMHTVDTPPDDDSKLCYHEDRGDGMPLCGQPLNPWTDENGVLRDVEWAPHLSGRDVLSFISNHHVGPDMEIELFLLQPKPGQTVAATDD